MFKLNRRCVYETAMCIAILLTLAGCAAGKQSRTEESFRSEVKATQAPTSSTAARRVPAIRIYGELMTVPRKSPLARLLPPILNDAGTIGSDTFKSLMTQPDVKILMRPRMTVGSGASCSFTMTRKDARFRVPLVDLTCFPNLRPDGRVDLKAMLLMDMEGSCEMITKEVVLAPAQDRYTFLGSCPQGKVEVFAFIGVEVAK